MCGISGFIKFSKDLSKSSISSFSNKMAKTLERRGPDAYGSWVDVKNGVSLSHRRLSILDLSQKANQPMMSHNKRFILSYNGEIYNFKFLKNKFKNYLPNLKTSSDTEVLVELIASIGLKETLKNINGIFCFAVWDVDKERMYVVRDRVGIKPVYIYWDNKNFAFASEIKALKVLPWHNFEICKESLGSYVRLNYIPSPYSIYENVLKLEPGCIFEINKSKVVKYTKYWDFEKLNILKNNNDPTSTHKILNDAVLSQMVSDVPVGVFLSGGIDSSLIAALAQKNSKKKINSFTIGFEDNAFDEAPYAKKISKILGTSHNEVYFNYKDLNSLINEIPILYDEPFADSSQLPTMLLSKITKKNVTVALSGDGGDELFGGYYRYFMAEKYQKYIFNQPNALKVILKNIIKFIPQALWNKIGVFIPKKYGGSQFGDKLLKLSNLLTENQDILFQQRIISNLNNVSSAVLNSNEKPNKYFEKKYQNLSDDIITRMQILDFLTYLPDDILTKVDRASMHYSLEVRVPFLDNKVIDHAWGLNKKFKVSNGNGKLILKEILLNYLPAKLIERPKMGFGIPLDKLLIEFFNKRIEMYLGSKKVKQQNLFNLDYYENLWVEHKSKKRNWQFLLWNFLMFQMWFECWGERK